MSQRCSRPSTVYGIRAPHRSANAIRICQHQQFDSRVPRRYSVARMWFQCATRWPLLKPRVPRVTVSWRASSTECFARLIKTSRSSRSPKTAYMQLVVLQAADELRWQMRALVCCGQSGSGKSATARMMVSWMLAGKVDSGHAHEPPAPAVRDGWEHTCRVASCCSQSQSIAQ